MGYQWYQMTDNETVRRALRNLVAIERDRQLRYPFGELHMNTRTALVDGVKALNELGDDPNDIISPEDQERLGIKEEL